VNKKILMAKLSPTNLQISGHDRSETILIYDLILSRYRKQTSLSGIKTASHKSIDRGCGCVDKYCCTQDGTTPAINKKQLASSTIMIKKSTVVIRL